MEEIENKTMRIVSRNLFFPSKKVEANEEEEKKKIEEIKSCALFTKSNTASEER